MNFAAHYANRLRTASDIVDHLPFLFDTVCRFPEARVLELGVRDGNSTAAFLAAVEAVGGYLWSVDCSEPRVPFEWLRGPWTLTVADDLAVEGTQPRDVDVLFIDTLHHYGHTLAELRVYVPHVKPGGIVLCHDTELEEPYQQPDGDPRFPVARALDAFCVETGRVWVNRSGCYGLGVIEVTA